MEYLFGLQVRNYPYLIASIEKSKQHRQFEERLLQQLINQLGRTETADMDRSIPTAHNLLEIKAKILISKHRGSIYRTQSTRSTTQSERALDSTRPKPDLMETDTETHDFNGSLDTLGWRNMAEWKQGAGRSKSWKPTTRRVPHYSVRPQSIQGGQVNCILLGKRPCCSVKPTRSLAVFAKGPYGIPTGLMKRLKKQQKVSCRAALCLQNTDVVQETKRRKWGGKGAKESKSQRSRRTREIIIDDHSLFHSTTSAAINDFNQELQHDMSQTSGNTKTGSTTADSPNPNDRIRKPNNLPTGTLNIPYENFMGAIIGNRFMLGRFFRAESCYDLHLASDLVEKSQTKR